MPRKANHDTERQSILKFDQIINIGPAMSSDFDRLGISSPQSLIGKDPLELYQRVCEVDQVFHDPCVLDVFIATIDYMNGNPPRSWWSFTQQRKERYSGEVAILRQKFARPH